MNDFDQNIRASVARESHPVPEAVHQRTEQMLEALPQRQRPPLRFWRRIGIAAASLAFVLILLLPNVSAGYAQAVENIPVLGDMVQFFTIRTYFYEKDRHNLAAEIPSVKDPRNPDASSLINKDVSELTTEVIRRFYDELQLYHGEGAGSLHMDYATLTNTPDWFTMKLTVETSQGSTDTYARFYHIDRLHGSYVQLGDLISEANLPRLEQMIREQMDAQMQADPSVTYLIREAKDGTSSLSLSRDQGFYFTENGDLVIVYDRYTVAPGSMGCPEFILPRAEIEPLLRYPAP